MREFPPEMKENLRSVSYEMRESCGKFFQSSRGYPLSTPYLLPIAPPLIGVENDSYWEHYLHTDLVFVLKHAIHFGHRYFLRIGRDIFRNISGILVEFQKEVWSLHTYHDIQTPHNFSAKVITFFITYLLFEELSTLSYAIEK
jgi:hypothetical protein